MKKVLLGIAAVVMMASCTRVETYKAKSVNNGASIVVTKDVGLDQDKRSFMIGDTITISSKGVISEGNRLFVIQSIL